MSSTLRHQVSKRASIGLTVHDIENLAAISESPFAPEALNIDGSMSEAALIHRLFELGVKHAKDALNEIGYAELAQDPEREEYDRVARARRRV